MSIAYRSNIDDIGNSINKINIEVKKLQDEIKEYTSQGNDIYGEKQSSPLYNLRSFEN